MVPTEATIGDELFERFVNQPQGLFPIAAGADGWHHWDPTLGHLIVTADSEDEVARTVEVVIGIASMRGWMICHSSDNDQLADRWKTLGVETGSADWLITQLGAEASRRRDEIAARRAPSLRCVPSPPIPILVVIDQSALNQATGPAIDEAWQDLVTHGTDVGIHLVIAARHLPDPKLSWLAVHASRLHLGDGLHDADPDHVAIAQIPSPSGSDGGRWSPLTSATGYCAVRAVRMGQLHDR